MAGRRSDATAALTREAIIDRAQIVASQGGFEALTFGSLATDLGLSKAGVIGHFPTKEALQLATYDAAAHTFRRLVVDPGARERGLARLRGYGERWASFIASPPWPGGCIITPAAFEYDGRPGPMADAIRVGMRWWRTQIADAAQQAVDGGELPPDTEPEQVAFVMVALATGAIRTRQMHDDDRAAHRLRRAYDALLGGADG